MIKDLGYTDNWKSTGVPEEFKSHEKLHKVKEVKLVNSKQYVCFECKITWYVKNESS